MLWAILLKAEVIGTLICLLLIIDVVDIFMTLF